MTKHKLDQLFKNKLEQVEVTPSDAAFEKFSHRINDRKKGYWYYIAASVSLLAIAAAVFWQVSENETSVQLTDDSRSIIAKDSLRKIASDEMIAQSNSKPEEVNEKIVFDETPAKSVKVQPAIKRVEIIEKQNLSVAIVAKEEITTEVKEPLETDRFNMIAQSTDSIPDISEAELIAIVEEPETEEIEVKPLPVVTITYKSGKKKKAILAENTAPRDTTNIKDGAFNKIFNSARSLADGSLIASFRDAKENLFNKNDD